MQATGSDQDKPLGSCTVFSLQGGLSIHTLLSICLLHTSVHISPSVSFLCLWFHFGFPLSSPPGWRLVQSDAVQKIQVWGFSGSPKPRVFVETTPCTPPPPAPPPSYTSVSHLHLGSKFSTRTEGGGGGPETSIPYGFLPLQIKTLFQMQGFWGFFLLQMVTPISEKQTCNRWEWLLKSDTYCETRVLTMQLRWHLFFG